MINVAVATVLRITPLQARRVEEITDELETGVGSGCMLPKDIIMPR